MATTKTAPKLLGIYLNDHFAGSLGGIRLARRAAGSNQATPLGGFLAKLADELEDERTLLGEAMERVGIKVSPVKQAAAAAAEVVARVKLNGRLTSYSPLSRLLELEALGMMVEGRLSLLRSIQAVGHQVGLQDLDVDRLIARARRQRRGIEEHRIEAAREALVSD